MAVPASVVVASCLCVSASACVSSGLAFCATFAVSLLFVARELSPEHIDGVFTAVDACLQKAACYARAAVEAETWRLRDDPARCHPAFAFLYDRTEGGARRARALVTDAVDRLKTWAAESKWRDMTDAAVAAFCWLRLTAGLINLAVAVLTTMAERRAASGLRRSGAHGIRTTPNTEADEAAMTSSSSKPDATLFVVWIAGTFTYSMPVFFQCAVTCGMASLVACFACFATLCCFALMQANKVNLWSPCDVAGINTAMAEVPHAWGLLWSEITLVTYLVDACLLCITLDSWPSRPVALAFVAICNLATLKVARQVDANGSAGVIRRRAHAVAVCAMGIAKVFVVCLVLDFPLGALRFAFLCSVIAFLLNKAAGSLPDVSAPVDANAGYADVAGDVELLPDYVNSEDLNNHATVSHEEEDDSNSPAACDRENEHDSSNSAAIDGEEEGTITKEYFDGSDSELVEEQRQEEEEDYGGGMDEWNLVETDSVMPINVNGGANGKFKRWPRKYLRRVV
uniref:DUF4220 domain-containing protein n=1 Tax=Oryza punctata TaxID=4537 RepID=A0A0E0KSU5_ORYPU